MRSNLAWDSKRIALRQLVDQGMRLGRGMEHGFGDPHGERVLPGDPVGQPRGAASISSAASWISVMRSTARASFGAQHQTGEQDLLGDGLPHELLSRQLAPAAARMPSPVSGLPIRTPGVPIRKSRGVGELGAAAEAVAVQGRDDRHRQLGDPDEDAWS